MKRDPKGKFVNNWNSETKQRVCLSVTSTAWHLLDEEAQKRQISRSELIERYARQIGNQTSQHEPNEPVEEQIAALKQANIRLQQQLIESQQEIQASQRREQELAALLENTPDAIARFDRQRRYLYANQAFEQILGLSRQILIGKTNAELPIPSEICLLWEKQIDRVFETEQNSEIEFELEISTGLRFYQARLVPEFDPQGAIASVLVASRDITQAKQAEQKRTQLILEQGLPEVSGQLTNVFEVLPEAVVCVDTEWRYTFINSCAEALFGKPRTEILGKIAWDVFPSVIETQAYTLAYQAMEQQQVIEYEYFYPDLNKWYYVRLNPSKTSLTCYFQDISERKQVEEALRQSEATARARAEELETFMETVPVAVFIASDPQCHQMTANRTAYELTQLPYGTPISATPVDGTYPYIFKIQKNGQDIPLSELPMQRAGSSGQEVEAELEFVFDNGYVRSLYGKSVPLRDSSGGVRGVIGAFLDITERKKIEEVYRNSEKKFRQLANAMPQMVWVMDAQGKTQYVNQKWWDYSGLAPDIDNAQGEINQAIHPDDISRVYQEWQKALVIGASYQQECRLRRGIDGAYRWFLVRTVPIKDEQNRVIQWCGTSTDIDDRKRSEEAQSYLAEVSKVLSSSLDYQITLTSVAQLTVPRLADWCVVHVINEDGSIEQLAAAHVDPAKVKWAWEMKDKYPVTTDEPRGTGFTLRTGKPDLIPDIPDELLVNGARDPEHLQMLREIGFKAVMSVPLIIQDRILGAISFVATNEFGRSYDEVDLALAEELGRRAALAVDNARLYQIAQRDRAEAEAANRIKDEFLAVLSHELRTPLNPILGWAQLLKTRNYDQKTVTRAIEIIERNAKLQSQLIEDLLDVSRILQGKLQLEFQPIDLNFVIASAIETVRLAAQAKSIQIKNRSDLNIGKVAGNSGRLQQVIWNLLSNAIKFTPQGGQVEITLQCVDNYAQIQVTDTGIGIAQEFLPHVFDYFRQADSKTTRTFGGLGLGLAIARHLIELHGGTISADSRGEGQGATFTIKLPAIAISQTKDKISPANETLSLNGIRVLLLDDEADTRDYLAFVLEESGAEVIVATSAAEALATLKRSTPDILLSDIGMPEMDGYMLIRQVRALAPEKGGQILAIALTAYAGEFNQQQALSAGFQAHLSKPVEPEELIKAIVNLISK